MVVDLLTCAICGAQFPNLIGHLRKHNLTGKQYKEKYEVDRIITREHAIIMGKASNKAQNTLEGKAKHADSMRKSYTQELRQKRRESAIRQFKNPEQRIIRSKYMSERVVSKETKEKLSKSSLGEWSKLRTSVLERSKYRCEMCGISSEELIQNGKKNLALHHKSYNKIISPPEELVVVCNSCHRSLHNQEGNLEASTAKAVIALLKTLKLDTSNHNFLETPRRFASVLREFSGLDQDFEQGCEELSESIFEHNGDNMIVASNLDSSALCPHHLMPVLYRITIGYIPRGYALGLSKMARFSELCAKRLQLQEDYTSFLASTLCTYLHIEDVAVITEAKHMCMIARGVKQQHAKVVVAEMRGAFKTNPETRAEFYQYREKL